MAESAAATQMSDEQVVQRYNQLRQEQSNIMSRIAELENESHEHQLVAEELRPLNADRCCHRLVGGALVERTVGDVLVEIEANIKGIQLILEERQKFLVEKEKEMDEFIVRHKLSQPGIQKSDVTASATEGNRGVLA